MSYDKEYLFENKNGVWYYNRKIPIDVTRVFGGRKVMKSLKTKNRAVAVEKARRMNDLYEDEWAHLLSSGGENPRDLVSSYIFLIWKAMKLERLY